MGKTVRRPYRGVPVRNEPYKKRKNNEYGDLKGSSSRDIEKLYDEDEDDDEDEGIDY